MLEFIYWDFDSNPVSVEQYKCFLKKYYGDTADARYERVVWYRQRRDYVILLALKDGELVGQTSSYRVSLFDKGNVVDIWWSVDSFVLTQARGLGIGKKLQKKMHEDYPNFSSLWYSRVNGIIKRKCSAEDLVLIPFNYYAVSSFFSVIFRIFFKKILKKEIFIPLVLKWKYGLINSLFSRCHYNVTAKEVSLADNVDELCHFIDLALVNNDLYVKRDRDYISWKYLSNPTIEKYNTLFFYSTSSELLGVAIFSEPFVKMALSIKLKVFTILDMFVLPNSGLTKKYIFNKVIEFYRKKNITLDGGLMLENISYFPYLRYPIKGTALLSTYKPVNKNFCLPYFAYSDQDMEQMIL